MEVQLQVIEASNVTPISAAPFPLGAAKFLPGKSEAAVEGALVVSGFRSGVRAVIDACVRTAETIRRFRDDSSAIDDFMAVLVDGNIISRSEARLGLASSKLSKFRTIGDHAELLCRDEILDHLEPGYTLIYQVVVLYNALEGDAEARFRGLVRILQAERPISREVLIAQTESAKRAKRGPAAAKPDFNSAGAANEIGKNGAKVSEQFELLLVTLDSRADLRGLRDDHADHPPPCLRIGERMAEQAVAVVVARLADLPTVENKLLPGCGFSGVARVLLLRDPIDPDVTDAQVVVVAERGQGESVNLANFRWLPHDDTLEAVYLASRLVPDARKKLHLFAAAESEGWCSIVGDANWRQADE
jgi:hypothetical protein